MFLHSSFFYRTSRITLSKTHVQIRTCTRGVMDIQGIISEKFTFLCGSNHICIQKLMKEPTCLPAETCQPLIIKPVVVTLFGTLHGYRQKGDANSPMEKWKIWGPA